MTPFPDVALALVREGVDLTMRQCAVLLTVARAEEAQTVLGLAWELNVPSPVITPAQSVSRAMPAVAFAGFRARTSARFCRSAHSSQSKRV